MANTAGCPPVTTFFAWSKPASRNIDISSSQPSFIPRFSAAIDGCSYVRYILQIVVPLLKPALSVVGLILAIRTWNDIIGPVIFLPSRAVKPISAGLLQFFAENTAEFTLIAAAIAITALPLLLLYIFTQRYIIAGMTSGALKG